ncbi:MAG: 50S ribosomal protein L23 [Patescibacteria group bacterium]
MALFDFLKKKKAIEKARETDKKSEKVSAEGKPAEKAKPIKADSQQSRRKASLGGFSYNAIKNPHISEKATALAEKNQYTFKTLAGANKTEIKKTVEGIYGVDVLSVNIIKIPAKKRRIGKTKGFKSGHIKAIVKIKEGQVIEIF